MAMVISTNTASINAQRHLNNSRQDLDVAMERLSSGQRINSAADDAAGLAIRDKMTSQIEGLNQAVRNANDAISFMQTAEGALEETTSILQRMRTLAVQASNDTNSDSDRTNLDNELQMLDAEITRIAENSTFNNKTLIDGSMVVGGFAGTANFAIGHNSSQNISVNLNDMSSSALGTSGTAAVAHSRDITLAGVVADAVDVYTFVVTDTSSNSTSNTAVTGAFATGTLLATAIVTAGNAANNGYTYSSDSGNIVVTSDTAGADSAFTLSGSVTTDADTNATMISEATSAALATGADAISASGTAISSIVVTSRSAAQTAITSIDNALKSVGDERSKLGAFQNRLQFAVNNMVNMSANTAAARSLIADADYAAESSSLAKNQILQQAGTAMLAQANAQAQSVLSLLK